MFRDLSEIQIDQWIFDSSKFIRKKFRSDLHIATNHEGYAESILHDITQSDDYKIKTLKIKKEKSFCTKFEDRAISKSSCVFYFVLNHR